MENVLKLKKNLLNLIIVLVGIILILFCVLENLNFKFITFNDTNILYIILSLFMNLLLVKIFLYIYYLCDIKFDNIEIVIMSLFLFMIFVGCSYSLFTREYAYYWDEVREYARNFKIEEILNNSNEESLFILIKKIRSEQRGPLINLFMAVPFLFTNKTPDAWIFSIFFNIFIPLIIIVGIFVKNVQKKLKVMDNHIIFLASYIMLFSMPLLYKSYLYGFPDLYGVIFCLCIILCLWNINFEKIEIKKWIILILLLILLALLRDQYIVWIISTYICFFPIYFLKLFFSKKVVQLKKCIKNVFLLGCMHGIMLLVVMMPYIQEYIAGFNSGKDNSFWRVGGYLYEIKYQMEYLGNWFSYLLIIALILGMILKRSRIYSIFIFMHGITTLVLFHSQVTLVAYNHSLTMLPFYFMCELILLYIITIIKNKYIKFLAFFGISILSIFNIYNACTNLDNWSKKMSCISLVIPKSQVSEIKVVANWLEEQCDEEDSIYFIPHGFPYNPDVFRYINMPNDTIMNKMSYGSAVLGYHSFPIEMLDAKYVITSEPFCDYGIANVYNDAFLEYYNISNKYILEKEFDMGDGYVIKIFERIEEIDIEEIKYYRNAVEEFNEKYPTLYEEVFERYIEEHF